MHTITLTLSDTQLMSILLDAHSSYWLNGRYELSYPDSKQVMTLSLREYDGERVINQKVGPKQIAEALQKMAAGTCDHAGSNVRWVFGQIMADMDVDFCGADGPTKDCVLQVAVFGKVVFG